jgi:hypothetical protein
MAKFKKTPVTPVYEFQLTLDEAEIRVLLTILHRVGGVPEGWRGVADRVKNALLESKLRDLPDTVLAEKSQYQSQNIYFNATKP